VIDVGELAPASATMPGQLERHRGRIELRATPKVWIDDLQYYPDAARRSVKVRGWIGNVAGAAGPVRIAFRFQPVRPGDRRPGREPEVFRAEVQLGSDGGSFEKEFALGPDVPAVGQFDPA
jgi:hypothetical protein